MATKRYTKRRKPNKRTQKKRKPVKKSKQWVTAVTAANATLKQTGSFDKAKEALRTQALRNARRLFGSVGEML